MLDRLTDLPVAVFDASWELIARNALADALLGELAPEPGRDRNILWRHFTGRPSRVVHKDDAAFECEAVADLHAALGRYPSDPVLRSLVADLASVSERFRELSGVAPRRRPGLEPQDVRACGGRADHARLRRAPRRRERRAHRDLQPAPGSPDAAAHALIGVVGLQALDVAG